MEIKKSISDIKYAGFGRRLLAFLVDGAILNVFTSVFTNSWKTQANMLEQLSKINSMAEFEKLQTITSNNNYSNLLPILISLIYFTVFVVHYDGATIGMRLLAIKLLPDDKSNNKISYLTAIVRNLSSYLSAMVFGLGYFAMIRNKQKQTWHDKIAKTVVVQTDRKPKRAIALIIGGFFLLFIITMSSIGILFSINLYKNEKTKIENKEANQESFSDFSNDMSEEVATKYQLSQDYFTQMKATQDEPTKIRKINNQNISILWEALELDPDNSILWFQLSSAYTWVNDKGNLEDGLDAIKKANEFDPDNAILLYQLGEYYIRLEQYDQAILELKKSLRLDDEYGYTHLSIANAYQQLGVNNNAIEHYQQALKYFENKNQDGDFDMVILTAQKGLAAVNK
ncbi:RDD family protein [Patescibacteria group bacterium]|nr:RDD family protein [Patescibacteria group bacterium]MBU1885693.1 RDD family protein [Patescibacteria group bacterium]